MDRTRQHKEKVYQPVQIVTDDLREAKASLLPAAEFTEHKMNS